MAAPVAEEVQAMLREAAEATCRALKGGAPEPASIAPLKELFLRESEDESAAAAERCRQLRGELAAQLLLVATEQGLPLAAGRHERPAVRVQVRGTAGRRMLAGAFTVGSDPYCDVHCWGDSTVAPLQCLVVSLPGSAVVLDVWSGTTRAWPQGQAQALALRHSERAVLRLGARTSLTLGPARGRKEPPKAARCLSGASTALPSGSSRSLGLHSAGSRSRSRRREPRAVQAAEDLVVCV
mmetsp:Transcript_8418/g.24747  ORF Transcript_8418/g.24747 Transcript_8418/m.24747 type:complete len:239 (+) Transcript_8418:61-777(+)|eukprot:CAMPEP_0168386802 /NCGR_PEP_ID=MMETSP0228-20121227/15616_1 /TAXON_ID=133427 /ORGANISM="Protoceratium reticulatum, Strain CCCM 535 (=CCMP 1889)" /LENGTH=238 /DNA_ID=CAMNT_0008400015 /DNA_START=61 /DNA_END=777 /DNA_ORIENTATION=+